MSQSAPGTPRGWQQQTSIIKSVTFGVHPAYREQLNGGFFSARELQQALVSATSGAAWRQHASMVHRRTQQRQQRIAQRAHGGAVATLRTELHRVNHALESTLKRLERAERDNPPYQYRDM